MFVNIFVFSLLGIHWAFWMCRLLFSINLRSFQALFLWRFFPLLSSSNYAHIGTSDVILHLSEALFVCFHSCFSMLFSLYNSYQYTCNLLILSSVTSNLLLISSSDFFKKFGVYISQNSSSCILSICPFCYI